MKTTEHMLREQAAYQFELQAHKLCYRVVKRLSNFRYLVENELSLTHEHVTAMVMAEAFDFYEYRLHAGRTRVQLLICQEHNAVLPIECVEMKTGLVYEPGQSPVVERESRKRRNQHEKKVLLSHLLLETERGQSELQTMALRMRQRYLKEKRMYLTPRIGRPIAS